MRLLISKRYILPTSKGVSLQNTLGMKSKCPFRDPLQLPSLLPKEKSKIRSFRQIMHPNELNFDWVWKVPVDRWTLVTAITTPLPPQLAFLASLPSPSPQTYPPLIPSQGQLFVAVLPR